MMLDVSPAPLVYPAAKPTPGTAVSTKVTDENQMVKSILNADFHAFMAKFDGSMLEKQYSNIDTIGPNGNTPLLLACVIARTLTNSFDKPDQNEARTQRQNNISRIIEHLVATGADVNAHNSEGYTPLMYMCASGDYLSQVETLLAAGADVLKSGRKYRSPITFWREGRDVNVLHLLAAWHVKYGKQMDASDYKLYHSSIVPVPGKPGQCTLKRALVCDHTKLVDQINCKTSD